ISGANGGVYVDHGVGTVTNSGTILGTADYGIYLLRGGGTVTNTAGALIKGGFTGVSVEFGYAGSILNQGTIIGTNYRGIYLGGGGTVTNAAGALISGLGKGVYLEGLSRVAALVNSGTVMATAVSGSVATYASGVYV